MDKFSSILLEGRVRFGKYPTDEEVALLKSHGYLIVLDLCPQAEITWTPYSREGLYYNHLPIPDRTPNVGDLQIFLTFILKLAEVIILGYKVYIHCRGGHGRSAVVGAVLYSQLVKCSGTDALKVVWQAHQNRTEMKPKYRKMGAPQTDAQKRFVRSVIDRTQ